MPRHLARSSEGARRRHRLQQFSAAPQTARLVLLDRQLAFVPHFAFCSRRRARLQAWDAPGAPAARAPPGTSPCSVGLQCNPIGKSSPLQDSRLLLPPPVRKAAREVVMRRAGLMIKASLTSSERKPAPQGRQAEERGSGKSCHNPISNEKSRRGKGRAAPPEPNALGMQLRSPSMNISPAGRTGA